MIEIEKPTIECIFSDEDPKYYFREQPEKNSSELIARCCRYFR